MYLLAEVTSWRQHPGYFASNVGRFALLCDKDDSVVVLKECFVESTYAGGGNAGHVGAGRVSFVLAGDQQTQALLTAK